MSTFRVEKTKDFTVMSNYHLKDTNLTLKAKGLLSQMLSLPDDWDYSIKGLMKINKEGKDAIRATVMELEKAGYVERNRTRNASGVFVGTDYVVYEKPKHLCDIQPKSDFPTLENPTSENPTSGNPPQLNTNNKQNTYKQNTYTNPTLPLVENVVGAEVVGGTKSDYDQYLEIIKKNIDYDCLIRSSRDSPWYKRQLDEIINIIADVVTFRTKPINIGSNTYSAEMVKSQFLKLNYDNISYVMEYIRSEMPTITNPKNYFTTVLFNSRFNSSSNI